MTGKHDSGIQSHAYLMSGEKPDRATSIYIPEPYGPITRPGGQVVTIWMESDSLEEKAKELI